MIGLALLPDPVDNRPYLMALAIDLYNSLPAGSDPEGFNDGEVGGKGMMYRYIHNGLIYDRREAEQRWGEAVGRGSAVYQEKEYLNEYVRGHVRLDAFGQPGSLDPARIDLQNPTHYAALTRWMAETVTARAEGVPPWEAAAWNAANRHRWESASAVSDAAPMPVTAEDSTAPAVTPPAPAQELTSPTGDAVTAAPAPSRGWLPAWLLGIAGVVVALLLWRRLRR